MLRYVPGRSSDRRRGRHGTKADQRGTRTTSNALDVQAGRPLIYEPQRVGAERIGTEELEGLLQIEAEASGIGIGNHGWKQVYDSEGAVLEQWEPGPDDAESELVFFRAMLTLEGVPLRLALAKMFDTAERQRWDSSIESLRCVPTVKTRTNSDGVQSDVVHFRTASLLGLFPSGECIMWRSLLERDGGSLAAVLLRNAEVNVTTGEINKDADHGWGSIVSPLRVRKLVCGHVFRSLDKTNEMKGSRVFTYVQVKANTALQYAAPHLAVSLATGSRDEYRKACLAAVVPSKQEAVRRKSEDAEFYDISSQCNDEDTSEQSAWDFLGGVLGKLAPQDRETRKTHRASLRDARKSKTRTSLQAPLRVVQLHRASTVDLNATPADLPEEGNRATASHAQVEHVQPTFTTDVLGRRSRSLRLRERSRASQHDSMAEMSKRLSTVMHERGNAQMEDEPGDSSVDRNDTMAWLSDLVDLRMSVRLGSALEYSPLTVEQPGSSTHAQVVCDGAKLQSNSTASDATPDLGKRSTALEVATLTEVEAVAAVGEIQPSHRHEDDLARKLQEDECSKQLDLTDEPQGLQGQAASVRDAREHSAGQLSSSSEVVADKESDHAALSPSSATPPSAETTSPISAAPRKKFTLPKMSRKTVPKVAEIELPATTSSSSAFSGTPTLAMQPSAPHRETSPAPSALPSPRSSCHDIYAEECHVPLADEIAVAEQCDEKAFSPSPQVGKMIQATVEELEIQPKKFLDEVPDPLACGNAASLYVGGLEPEPGPEPGPDSPCLLPPRRPPREEIAFATEVYDMTEADRLPNGNAEGGSKQGVQSSGTRCSIRAQLGGGKVAPTRSESAATTPVSDALLFRSVKEITSAAKAAKKLKSKSKSDVEHHKSRHLW